MKLNMLLLLVVTVASIVVGAWAFAEDARERDTGNSRGKLYLGVVCMIVAGGCSLTVLALALSRRGQSKGSESNAEVQRGQRVADYLQSIYTQDSSTRTSSLSSGENTMYGKGAPDQRTKF